MGSSVRVKICGITRGEDADLARSLGAWAVGFIFYAKSPRFIHAEQVRGILSSSKSDVKAVGVFVNESQEVILNTLSRAPLNAIQLHGDESAEFCGELKKKLPGYLLIKAFRPRELADLELIKAYSMCDHVLLDHYDSTECGGTGKTGDWELALRAKKLGSVILAGGLNAGNVQAAIAQVNPYALDVSSKLETSPGIKSEKKMREFFEALVKA